ncbi:MAG: 50S ribosomal protein L11 methyltransferase [Cyanophyceae cyanobacterium]
MSNFSIDTRLQRVPNLTIEIDASNQVQIVWSGRSYRGGQHALAVLEVFAYPTSVSEALERLKAQVQGVQDWMNLTSTVLRLHQVGILQEAGQLPAVLRADPLGYDAAAVHIAMLNDRQRTSQLISGIQAVVRPGDVVVDIGTGTGVLAIAAAQAGAKQVYAIEASSIGKSAQALFEVNGLADRITLVPGWSTQVSLPERADVLVTEMIGDEPLSERALEVTIDARKRLLQPKPRFVPGKLQVMGLAITIPPEKLAQKTWTAPTLKTWQSWYGIDFRALAAMARSDHTFYVRADTPKEWLTLSEPLLLADVDFATVTNTGFSHTVSAIAQTAGTINGLLIYFDVEFSPNNWLTTHPAQVPPDNHWYSLVWALGKPLPVSLGERFQVTYTHRLAAPRITVSSGS